MGKRRGNQISLTRATTRPVELEDETPDVDLPEQEDEQAEVKSAAPQQTAALPQNPAPQESAQPEMLRTTMFFTVEMIDRLDAAKTSLSQLTGIRGRAVSRTRIVEMALEVMLTDLEKRQADSALVSVLTGKQA